MKERKGTQKTIYLTTELSEKIEAIAEADKKSFSFVLNEALEKGLKQ